MSIAPRLFQIIAADAACTALLGANPVRFYPAGQANKQTPQPYATYGVTLGTPQNYLDKPADMDQKSTQIDIYGKTFADVDAVFEAIRAALEPVINQISIGAFATPDRDGDTGLYHARLEVDAWESR